MIEWLQLTDEQRREILAQAQVHSGIPMKALEKDWWVTLTLKALFQTPFAHWMVFKGGTSLSKGWRLIERFSEDIDIALAPEAFGMQYEAQPNKAFINKLKRQGCIFTSTTLRGALWTALSDLGIADGAVTIEAAAVPPDHPDTDPQTLHVRYTSLYEPNPYIADEVKIEVSVRSVSIPFTPRLILSLLSEYFPNPAYPEQPFEVPVVEPRKTFLEKGFLLHEEFSKPLDRVRTERLTRHLYDLFRNRTSEAMHAALQDHDLYSHLIQHRERYNRISGIDYSTHHHSTISFLPPAELLLPLREDYATMQQYMIYGESPAFEELLEELKILQGRFRLKEKSRSLEEIIEIAQATAEDQGGEKIQVMVIIPPTQPDTRELRYQVGFTRKGQNLVFEALRIVSS